MDTRKDFFYRSSSEFKAQKNYKIFDDYKHHSAFLMIDKKDEQWILIKNISMGNSYRLQSLETTVLVGELYRFINIMSPEYAIYNNEYLISKEITASYDFFDYFEKYIYRTIEYKKTPLTYEGNNFMQGMGTDILSLLFANGDKHLGNMLVTKDQKYCVMIDHDWTLFPITTAFHKYQSDLKLGSPLFTVEEYDHFPLINKDRVRINWEWQSKFKFRKKQNTEKYEYVSRKDNLVILPYSQALSKADIFLNEKHFYAFKFLLTSFYHDILMSYGMNEKYINSTSTLLIALSSCTLNVLKNSKPFQLWFRLHYKNAIEAILFEINEYINLSNRYFATTVEKDKIWHTLLDHLFKNLIVVLTALGVECSEDNAKEMLSRADNIRSCSATSLAKIADFYNKQKMTIFAELVYIKLMIPFDGAISSRLIEVFSQPLEEKDQLELVSYNNVQTQSIIIEKKESSNTDEGFEVKNINVDGNQGIVIRKEGYSGTNEDFEVKNINVDGNQGIVIRKEGYSGTNEDFEVKNINVDRDQSPVISKRRYSETNEDFEVKNINVDRDQSTVISKRRYSETDENFEVKNINVDQNQSIVISKRRYSEDYEDFEVRNTSIDQNQNTPTMNRNYLYSNFSPNDVDYFKKVNIKENEINNITPLQDFTLFSTFPDATKVVEHSFSQPKMNKKINSYSRGL